MTTTARSISTSRTSVQTFSSGTTATARSPTAPLDLGVAASGWSTGCAFLDADADGDLDLYVARYVNASWADVPAAQRTLVWRGGPRTMTGPKGMPGEADLFFENKGDGTFVEAAEAHGLVDAARGYGYGVLATDYDADGWVDLFVANDTTPNFLYRNLGDGRFESVGLASGVALNGEGRAQAGMGVDSADYDGDGRLDLVVTNFAHDVNTLYRNRDGRQFEDVTAAAGLAAPTFVRMGWGTAFFDADLDGAADLFFANGHIYPNVDDYPGAPGDVSSEEPVARQPAAPLPDVSETAGAQDLQVAKSSRGLADRRSRQRRRSGSRHEQHGRGADGAGESAADRTSLGGSAAAQSLAQTASASARGSPSRRLDAGRCARFDPAVAICRRATCVRSLDLARTPARSTWRFACLAVPRGIGRDSRSIGC